MSRGHSSISPKEYSELLKLFASIASPKEADQLLQDILTPQELVSLTERWHIVRELAKGTPQRTIASKLKVSISKITRGSRVMQFGTGGFKLFLQKLVRL